MRVFFKLMWGISSTIVVTSFITTSCPSSKSKALVPQSVLFSSPTPSDPFDDDALSKLMNKRKQIQELKKDKPKPKTEDDYLNEIENWENLDKPPELKTKRPSLQPRKSSKEQKEDEKEKRQKQESAVDFLSEYDDENDLHIPNRIGFTTAGWGDVNRGFVAKGKLTKKMIREGKYVPGDLQVAYNNLMEAGVSFVQTSEAHGVASRSSELSAEHILARCMEENDDFTPIVADTFSSPWTRVLSNGVRFGSRSVMKALKASCSRMGTSSVELYQVENSLLYPGGKRSLAAGLATAIDRGYCNYVGVVNCGRGTMKSFARKLDRNGIQLNSNQFEFSLTNRGAWKSGLIDACKDLGVVPLVSNPLDGGLASGRYTASNPSGGDAGGKQKYSFDLLEKLQELHSVQDTVAERAKNRVKREVRDMSDRYKRRYGPTPNINTDITTTQVAINYVIAKGAVPLIDVNNPADAKELLGCLGWSLSDDEVQMLDAAASLCKR